MMIKIKAYKYPHHLHYEWEAELLERTEDYVKVKCHSGRKLIHHTKGKVFTMPHPSVEYLFLNEWYTVAITTLDCGSLSYYCNVAMPSRFEDKDTLSFIDLDLDLLKHPGEDWKIVDEDEFIENQIKYQYPQYIIDSAQQALERLLEKVNSKQFPFHH